MHSCRPELSLELRAEVALLVHQPRDPDAWLDATEAASLASWDAAACVFDGRSRQSFHAAHGRMLRAAQAAGNQLACVFVVHHQDSASKVLPGCLWGQRGVQAEHTGGYTGRT